MTTTPDDPDAADAPAEDDLDWDGISLEELGEAYAEAIARSGDSRSTTTAQNEAETASQPPAGDEVAAITEESDRQADTASAANESSPAEAHDAIPTPGAIIEAALFIGNPENRGMSDRELASLMRDVTAADVNDYVDRLNEAYQANRQALRIHRDEDGFRMGVAPDLEIVRRAFHGKIRETRLSQAAIEVLSLVAYQPGVTAERVQEQRGKESASLLSQLVRRRLLELRRREVEGVKRPVATYYPTERFLNLFGLESLDDLPQVED